jgi:hypothetical protein
MNDNANSRQTTDIIDEPHGGVAMWLDEKEIA